jgi:DNA-binding CsgD family transcriptional regulator
VSPTSAQLDALVGDIYDAALEPGLWPGTLERVADAVGGAQVMMGIHDFANGALQVLAPRMDPEHFASYRDHWWTGDQLWQRTNAAPVGQVLHAERFVPRNELERSAFYSEWYRRLQLGVAGLGANLYVEAGVPAMCGIKRARHRGDFSATQVGCFRALVPHLARAARLHRRAWDLQLREGLLAAGVDRSRSAVFATDARGRIAYMSPRAQALLREGDGLCARRSVLAAAQAPGAAELARRLAQAGDPRGLDLPAGGDAFEIPRAGRGPLRLCVLPFPALAAEPQAGWPAASRPTALVVARDPEAERNDLGQALQRRFALTPAEAALALEIVQCEGRDAAARRLGIAPGTARIQLQRVFDKTGVHRQAELVRLLGQLGRD